MSPTNMNVVVDDEINNGNNNNKKNGNNNTKNENIDEILNYLGNIGPYQWIVYLQSILPTFIAGMLSTSFVFTTATPEHRCFVPGCDSIDQQDSTGSLSLPSSYRSHSLEELFNQTFLKFTIPTIRNSDNDAAINNNLNQFDNCKIFQQKFYPTTMDNNNGLCSIDWFDLNKTKNCDDLYKFNDFYFKSTIVTEFQLFCNNSWIVQMLQSMFFFGVLLGAIINGILADKCGRRLIFRIYSPLTFLSILIGTMAPNLSIYAIALFIKGICVAGIYQSAFTIGIECLGGKWRFWLGNSYSIIFASGGIYACLTSYWFRNWKLIEATQLIPAVLMLPYPFILAESIRWQFSAGEISNALIQVEKMARRNGVEIPENVLENFLQKTNEQIQLKKLSLTSSSSLNCNEKPDAVIWDLFRHSLIRRWTLTFIFIWFTNALVYYGMAFLASDINENIYLSMILLMTVEFPGTLIASYAGEFSRKKVLMTIMIIGGLACVLCAFVPSNSGNGGMNLKMWLAILGKMSISGSFSLIYVYSAEIFPTVLRITGLGMCSFFSRFGAMTAPYLLRLHFLGDSFPFLVIGIITFSAGLASILLPETKGKKLPDSLEEVEMLKNSVNNNNNIINNKLKRRDANYLNLKQNDIKNFDEIKDLLSNEPKRF